MSERQKQHSTDEARGRYWHQMLNMADDDLDPYAYRLLGHYIRVDGCWETVRTTALVTRMSVGKVVKTRNALQDGGWINVELSEHDTYLITVIDRMKENVERYERLAREKKARSRGEHALNGVHEVNNDVHVVKNRKFKRVHEVKQRRTEEPREEELKDYAARSAAARATDLPPQVPETWSVADEGDEYQSLSVGKRAQATRTKRAKDKLQTTPPSSPDGARPPSSPKSRSAKQDQDAALVTALADAWGIPPANSDYGLYIRVARQMAKDIAPDQFKTFCAWRKQQAGDFADKLTIANMSGNGWMSKFLAVQDEIVREQERKARLRQESEERDRLYYEKHPEAHPDYVPPGGYARPEKIAQVQAALRAKGFDV